MISTVMFVVTHFVLGLGVFWSVHIQESGVVSVMNAVTIISFILVSFLNYWIWLCPMDRNRDVRCSEIALNQNRISFIQYHSHLLFL